MSIRLHLIVGSLLLVAPWIGASGKTTLAEDLSVMLAGVTMLDAFTASIDSLWVARFGEPIYPGMLLSRPYPIGHGLRRNCYILQRDRESVDLTFYREGNELIAAVCRVAGPGRRDAMTVSQVYRPARLADIRASLRASAGLAITRYASDSLLLPSAFDGASRPTFGYSCTNSGSPPPARLAMKRLYDNGNRDSIVRIIGSLNPELRVYAFEAMLAIDNAPSRSPTTRERLAALVGDGEIRMCSGCDVFSGDAAFFLEEVFTFEKENWARWFQR